MVFPAGADSINWFFMSCIFMLLFIWGHPPLCPSPRAHGLIGHELKLLFVVHANSMIQKLIEY
jgi:hypothetical protein